MTHSTHYVEVYKLPSGQISEQEPVFGNDYSIAVIMEIRKGEKIISRDQAVKQGGFFPASDPDASKKAKAFRQAQ